MQKKQKKIIKWLLGICFILLLNLEKTEHVLANNIENNVESNTYYATSSKKPKQVKLNKTTLRLRVGKTVKLKLKGASGNVTWRTSKKSVATVNANGLVKGKKNGTVNYCCP